MPKYPTFPRNGAANGMEFNPNMRGGAGGQRGGRYISYECCFILILLRKPCACDIVEQEHM